MNMQTTPFLLSTAESLYLYIARDFSITPRKTLCFLLYTFTYRRYFLLICFSLNHSCFGNSCNFGVTIRGRLRVFFPFAILTALLLHSYTFWQINTIIKTIFLLLFWHSFSIKGMIQFFYIRFKK